MKNVELNIPGMQSAHCQTRVSDAIKNMGGVKVEKLESTKLSVSVESEEIKEELVETIKRAGYKVEGYDSEKESGSSASCCSN